jgi:glycosyltransferase involved in cell wall biosynthesis
VLQIVAAQDYDNLELLVSDNGMNGSKVRDIVEANYPRPSRFRQNSATVGMSVHFNQIIEEASGEYFLLLADDDEISANCISVLVELLERHPKAALAMGLQETIDESGAFLRSSRAELRELLSGPEFIRALWETREYGYESISTFLARRSHLIACGGFPDFWKGSGNDDALLVKLCLDSFVALSPRCAFRKRWYDTSYGFAMTTQDLARSVKEFLDFIKSDPVIVRFVMEHPGEWREARRVLVGNAWKTYYFRWADMYKERMNPFAWAKAGFALPYIPEYYRAVAQTLGAEAIAAIWQQIKRHAPWAYEVYRAGKARCSRGARLFSMIIGLICASSERE